MGIDFYINNISSDKLIGSGLNKKCYDFGDVVLLEQKCSEDWINNEINSISRVKSKLDSLDVNSFKILDYKAKDNFVYTLQTKIIGDAIQEYKCNLSYNVTSLEEAKEEYSISRKHLEKYIIRLSQLNNYKILEKFFLDYVSITNTGIFVDPSKTTNFLFDGMNVWFLDLNCYDERKCNVSDVVYYILYLICWCKSYDATTDEINDISFYLQSIYLKLMDISKKHGFDIGKTSFDRNVSDVIASKISSFIKYSKSEQDYIDDYTNTK